MRVFFALGCFRSIIILTCILPVLITCLDISVTVISAENKKSKSPNNNSSAMPRILPRTPEEALKSFELHADFQMELVAAEPLIRDPVEMCFDERGRAYVVELPEYNSSAKSGFSSIKLLEDTNGDGKFDKSFPFLSDLTLPTAVFSYKGGIFIAASPHIYYCKDTDGDRIADVREIVMTGFGRYKGNAGLMNSFRWGIENKIHFSTALSGGIVTVNSDKQKRKYNTRGRNVIFDPETRTIELTTGGGQHGMSLGNWNRTFVCSNSVPMQVLMYDDRYIARNPYLAPPAAQALMAPGGKYTKLLRISESEPWRILRTHLRTQSVRGDHEKGKTSGFFTAASGITIYRGDAWPEKYQGNVLVGEPANNLVYRAIPKRNGLSLVAPRADQKAEFLASTDVWFRPVQFQNGPNGSLYVLDMYRELIEGTPFIPEEVLKQINPVGGQDKGRIYRIIPKGFQQLPLPDYTKYSSQQLVTLLESKNGWTRDTAQRLLYERQDSSVTNSLKKLVTTSDKPITRATALWSLDGLKSLDETILLKELRDKDFHVRQQSLRIAEKFATSPRIQDQMIAMAKDPALEVQYQVAFSLGSFYSKARNQALVEILSRNVANRWIRMAVQSSLNQGAAEVFSSLVKNSQFLKEKHGQEFLAALAVQIGAQNNSESVQLLMRALETMPQTNQGFAVIVFRKLLSRASTSTKKVLSQSTSKHTEQLFKEMTQTAIQQALNSKRDVEVRLDAIDALAVGKIDKTIEAFKELLYVQQPLPVRQRAITTLGLIDDDRVARLILESWPGLSPQLRMSAVETLFSRDTWTILMLDSIKEGKINPGDVNSERVQLLKTNRNIKIKKMAQSLFHKQRITRRSDVVKNYQSSLSLKGNPVIGKQVFKKTCAACHRLENVGVALGADLKAIKDRGVEAVLLNILDPNREVKPQYVTYLLVTIQGRTITGIIKAENANSITIARADGTSDTVLRLDIDELISSRLSFMPEGLEKQINQQEMADLLSYLYSIK